MNNLLKRADFHFYLPTELIAQQPLPDRSASRLLVLNRKEGRFADSQFKRLSSWLRAGDLLVFNDTQVIPARLFGNKHSGGRVEVLIERVIGDHLALAQVRASRSPRIDTYMRLADAFDVVVIGRQADLFKLQFKTESTVFELLDEYGHIPLPPYIERADEAEDRQRYQTVYAQTAGAVAAPTAGLHFDQPLLTQLQQHGIEQAFITLHVGAGTFQPLRADDITAHQMHSERFEISAEVGKKIAATKARGGRVIAVGTTVVRSLEAASASGELKPMSAETDIYITPGYQFRCVDGLITNFHLPESTLLILVTAFADYTAVMQAYRHAIAQSYRFFSYGDAMLII